jgi:hypothetical protein
MLLFGSGAAALVYQTLWDKLALVVGVDVYAITTAVTPSSGLAIGGAAFSAAPIARPARSRSTRGSNRRRGARPAATIALARSAPAFVAMQAWAGALAWTIPFVLIGAPAALMGGTLPALVRALEPRATAVAGASGALYAANTAGGIAGALATPFVLVPMLGVHGTAGAAAAANLLLAAAALAVSRPRAARAPQGPAPARTRDVTFALVLYAIAGGVLGYEVAWAHAIVRSSAPPRMPSRWCWRPLTKRCSAAPSTPGSPIASDGPGSCSACCRPPPAPRRWQGLPG